MGYYTEVNTLLRFTKDYDISQFTIGKKYSLTRERERIFPLHIAILMVSNEWKFLGYAVVHSAELKEQTTVLNFEIVSLFTEEESNIYSKRFMEAAKKTGEIK